MEVVSKSTLDVLNAGDPALDDDDGYAGAKGDGVDEHPAAICTEPTGQSLRRPVSACELFAVHGEAMRSQLSKKRTGKRSTSIRAKRNNQDPSSRDPSEDTQVRRKLHEEETHRLRDQLAQLQRELDHARDERDEVQVAFRRLDHEIGNGYNLAERKQQELRIGELVTKNQKLSQMLEKELHTQETLRALNNDLESQVRSLRQQATLVNQVLSSVESKYIALVQVNNELTTNHAAVQERLASLQDELLQVQARVVHSQKNVDYEEKLRLWETKYGELQRKLDAKHAILRAEQERMQALQQKMEKTLEAKAGLESEIASIHDQMIKMQGAMTSMEARVEANASKREQDFVDEKARAMKQRVRLLEEELVTKNLLIADLKESFDGLPTYDAMGRSPAQNTRRRPTSGKSRASVIASRVVSLTQKLLQAEESRDHNARCLDVLVGALPPLLQQLDALQDKFHAAVESNTILSSAVEQLQGSELDHELLLHQPAVALARERYLLSGPYQPELLTGFTLSRAFSQVAVTPDTRQGTKFMPFQVRTMARTTTSEATNSHGSPQVVLTGASDDASGAAFLNRSKINAFLHFVQGKAGKTKATPLLMQKIADLLSAQRELLYQHSTESGFLKVLVAKLEGEVQQLKRKLHRTQFELANAVQADADTHSKHPNKLLLKLIDAFNGSPLAKPQTFVTQHGNEDSSHSMVLDGRTKPTNTVRLDLADCKLSDEDIEPLLLKLSVRRIRVSEIDLSENEISDDGAATLAASLETCALNCLCVVDLRGNARITPDGVARLRTALMRNRHVHHVDIDETRLVILAIAAEYQFDAAGKPLVLLEVRLPQQAFVQYTAERRQELGVQTMIERLQSKGFCDTSANLSRAEAVYRQPQTTSRRVVAKGMKLTRPVTATVKPKVSRAHQSQQEKKFRALENAIRRADESSTRVGVTKPAASATKGISITQIQHLLRNASRPASNSTLGPFSSHGLRKLQFAHSHLAMVRRLSAKNE